MQALLEKENNTYNKISKPDFSTKTGREFLAFYLQTKFKQIIAYDKKNESPIFIDIKHDFISRFAKRIINNPEKRILVGICGESASGKTTICNTIKHSTEKLSMPVEIISSDNYFNDISELIRVHGNFDNLLESGYDIDAPENFQLEQLREDLEALSMGKDIKTPQYLINGSGVNLPKALDAKSQKIIVVEGMASMFGNVHELFDVIIYVDIDRNLQKEWFLQRAKTRNQEYENALKQLSYVRKASEKYILPQKPKADIIINGGSALNYFEQIIEYIHTITNSFLSQEN